MRMMDEWVRTDHMIIHCLKEKEKRYCVEVFSCLFTGESRGVGGIFFDDLDSPSQEKVFQFVKV